MKKVLFILSTLFMMMACSNLEQGIDEKASEDGQDIKVNIVIKRANFTGDTKATVKSGFADGDKVFLLFETVAAPKYLELTYSSSSWIASAKNGLGSSDLPASGEMTTLYLPYGKDFTVTADGTSFLFQKGGENYSGHFYYKENVAYTFSANTVSAENISLVAAAPASGDDVLVHFDVSGYTKGHSYNMYQDYMKPMSLTSITADGTVNTAVGDKGDAIRGYEDASFLSFSGVLDATVKANDVDYQFSINDETDCVLYTRDAGNQTVRKNMYIGIGNISTATWNANEYVDLGIVYDGKRVMWAKKNLGATAETGEGSYGKYYAWGDFVGYALDGTYGSYTCSHTFEAEPQNVPSDHLMTMTDESTPSYMQFRLKPEYDPAHEELKGLWRMPIEYKGMIDGKYRGEMVLLRSNTTQTLSGTLGTVTAGFIFSGNGNTMFVPFAGCIEGDALLNYDNPWHIANYLTSGCFRNTSGAVRNSFLKFFVGYNESNGNSMISYSETTTGDGFLIRPCFSIK